MFSRRSLLLLLPAALLVGCGESGPPPNAPTGALVRPPLPPKYRDKYKDKAPDAPGKDAPKPSGAGMKVGLITNGSLTDSGWNSLAGEGLEQIKNDLGAEISHQSARPEAAEEALRAFARDKFRIVFAHGSEFGDAAKAVAADNPDTIFVVSSGEVKGENLASLRYDLGEASYLAGMLAGAMSKTGKAGQIGGQEFPPVRTAFELFEKGGKAVNPKFKANTTYLGNWEDAGAAKERALAMIRDGADVIFQNCDAAAEGIFQAVEESTGKGIMVVGSNANQNSLHPQFIVASAVLDVPKSFANLAKSVQDGSFKGDVFLNDLKSGNVYLAQNADATKGVPKPVLDRIRAAEADIKSGKLKLITK